MKAAVTISFATTHRSWHGFTGTASWGEDDGWDVGVRYKGEFGDFKLAGGIAYGEQN